MTNEKKLVMRFDPNTIEHLGVKMYSSPSFGRGCKREECLVLTRPLCEDISLAPRASQYQVVRRLIP